MHLSPAPKTRAPCPARETLHTPAPPSSQYTPACRPLLSPTHNISPPLFPARRFSAHCPHPAPTLSHPLPDSCRLSLCQHTQKECPKALPCVLYTAAHRAVFPHLNRRIALSLLSEVTQPQRRRRLALAPAHDAGDDQHDDGDEVRDHFDDLALRKRHADIVGQQIQHAEQY